MNNYNNSNSKAEPYTLQLNYQNNNDTKEEDLPRLGRKRSSIKKSVSFNEAISITQVENWKKYNVDLTTETEFFKLKQQINEFKKRKMEKEKNDCCCQIV